MASKTHQFTVDLVHYDRTGWGIHLTRRTYINGVAQATQNIRSHYYSDARILDALGQVLTQQIDLIRSEEDRAALEAADEEWAGPAPENTEPPY